jgi:hypothetical protein
VAVGEALGHPVPYVQLPLAPIRAYNADFGYSYEWLNTLGYRADLDATRAALPGIMDFRTWLDRTGGAQIQAFFAAAATAAPA